MSRAAPGKEEPGSRPSKPGRRSKKLVRGYRPYRHFASIYSRLLAERYANGLLTPFRCAGCTTLTLDPVGWNGPHMPLCEICVDAEGRDS
jgi:hypothetical protein